MKLLIINFYFDFRFVFQRIFEKKNLFRISIRCFPNIFSVTKQVQRDWFDFLFYLLITISD